MSSDEDVLACLQLLAYVLQYCNLSSYFRQFHLVPRLKIGSSIQLLNLEYNPAISPCPTQEELYGFWDNEFLEEASKSSYNICPLTEIFTVKPSLPPNFHGYQLQGDMEYWACVLLENMCRKDKSTRGIRQCAYWQCGKWERYYRQSAKCRRCRRTAYCSNDGQKALGADAGSGVKSQSTAEMAEPEVAKRDHNQHDFSFQHSFTK